ncbi:hypothetical protein J6590_026963 [Homalodisca vitripennis]|nr:hypothetical protein J6590_026963 [Homalodisca vitripennis]
MPTPTLIQLPRRVLKPNLANKSAEGISPVYVRPRQKGHQMSPIRRVDTFFSVIYPLLPSPGVPVTATTPAPYHPPAKFYDQSRTPTG